MPAPLAMVCVAAGVPQAASEKNETPVGGTAEGVTTTSETASVGVPPESFSVPTTAAEQTPAVSVCAPEVMAIAAGGFATVVSVTLVIVDWSEVARLSPTAESVSSSVSRSQR